MDSIGRYLDRVNRFFEKVESVFVMAGAVVLAVMVVLIFSDIVSRKLFDKSVHIALEYSEYGLAFIMVMALASVTGKNEHLRVTVFVDKLGKSARRVFHVLFNLMVFLVYNLVITYMCYRLFSESWVLDTHSQSIARTPMWIPQIVLVIGLVIADVRLLVDILRAAFSTEYNEGSRKKENG